MTEAIGVFVVDDHPVVLEGTRMVLEDAPDLRLVGSASEPSGAAAAIRRLLPDVVLLDVRLGQHDPTALVRLLSAAAPQVAVLLFTADVGHRSIPAALAAGARGVASKDLGPAGLITAIRAVARGERVSDSGVVDPLTLAASALTPRELEVLRHVVLGQTNPEIALELGLTTNTVKTYWQATMQKLNVRNRAEAIGVAHRLGLLHDFS